MSTNSFFYFLTFILMCTLYNMNCRKRANPKPYGKRGNKKRFRAKERSHKNNEVKISLLTFMLLVLSVNLNKIINK